VLRLAARPREVLAGEPGAAVLRVRARRKNGGIRLLVDDERLFNKLDNEFRSILFELIKPRHGIDRLLYAAQEKKDWHPRLGGVGHADSIMDRILHNPV